MWDPETIAALQLAARDPERAPEAYEEFARRVNEENGERGMIRGLLALRERDPVPLDDVEPAPEIMRRFVTGGMSLGALSPEAHETLAVAMNRIGGMSNSRRGRRGPRAATPRTRTATSAARGSSRSPPGASASTPHYLASADQIQIKISQGSKPGEGGQLPGHKVDPYIATLRFSTPGRRPDLAPAPPRHLLDRGPEAADLRPARRQPGRRPSRSSSPPRPASARSPPASPRRAPTTSSSPATTAAPAPPPSPRSSPPACPGSSASPRPSRRCSRNGLRSRVVLQADGQMRTGRDVVIAALLGADEVGFATAPLIATGCIMMRVCHLNTCPVGVATQDPELRKRFAGRPEHVVDYLAMVAGEARELIAALGVSPLRGPRRPRRAARPGRGRSRTASAPASTSARCWPCRENVDAEAPRHRTRAPGAPDPHFDERELVAAAAPALERGEPVRIERRRRQRRPRRRRPPLARGRQPPWPESASPRARSRSTCTAPPGQSFGAWLAPGITLTLARRGQRLRRQGPLRRHPRHPPAGGIRVRPERNVIAGNVVLYGATGGRAFFSGLAGERFAVRNSGAEAVVEGVGDHGCEYMTGGHVVVLGETGRNFAAGMSGGIAYVYDPDGELPGRLNAELVDLEELDRRTTSSTCATLIAEHARRTGSALALRAARRLGPGSRKHFVRVMPREYARALAESPPRPTPKRSRRRMPARCRHEPRPARLHEDPARRRARARPGASASATTARSTDAADEASCADQGARCMDCGVPFCNNGCPLGNLIPDWNDLVRTRRLARGDRAAPRDQQLPRVHRPDLPGALRVGLRARHRRRPGDDQADRVRDHRARLRGGLGRRRAAADAHRPHGRRRRLRARPGWPRRTS